MPFGNNGEYKDWEDCTSKNKDKDNPEAYCGYIKHKTEDIIPPGCLVKAYNFYMEKFPHLSKREILDKSFNYFKGKRDFTEDSEDCKWITKDGRHVCITLKNIHRKLYNEILNEISETNNEKGYLIDEKGKQIKIEGKGSQIDPWEVRRLDKELGSNITFIHSHPTNNPFSSEDIELFIMNSKHRKLGVITKEGEIYELEKPKNIIKYSNEDIIKSKQRYKDVFRKIKDLEDKEIIDQAIQSFALKYNLKYNRSINDFTEEPQSLNLILDSIGQEYDLLIEDFLTTDQIAGSRIPEGGTRLQRQQQLLQQYEESYQTPEAQAMREGMGGSLIPPLESITRPFSLMNTETGAIIRGEVNENLRKNLKELTPVSSSNVRGVGQFRNELLVQFHSKGLTPQRTYRYQMETPEMAEEAYRSLASSGSPGRWVWQNIRGHTAGEEVTKSKLGPSLSPPGKGYPVIGGTTASLAEYSISNRVPVDRVEKFEQMSKQLKRETSNPQLNPNTGSRVERLLKEREASRNIGLKHQEIARQVRQLPKLDFKVITLNTNDLKLINDYAYNFNPAEAKLIIESLESLVNNENDPFFAATARNIIQQIEGKSTGKFGSLEESAMYSREQIEEEYGEGGLLKKLADEFHDSLISIIAASDDYIDKFSNEFDELEEGPFFGFDTFAEFVYKTLTESLDPEQYNETSIDTFKDKINQIKAKNDFKGLTDLVYDKLLAIGSEESDQWRESLKEEFQEFRDYSKKAVKGKGWWGESERHSKAKRTGKADLITDSLEECFQYYEKKGKSEEESKKICFSAINKKETEATEKVKQPYKEGKYYDISKLKRKLKWGERVRLEYIKDGVETFPKKMFDNAHPDIIIAEKIPDYYPERKGKVPFYYQQVGIDVTYDYVSGSYDPNQNRCIVSLTNMGSKNDVIGTVQHELAHAVWEYGGTPINLKYDLSDRLKGWINHIGDKYYHTETEMFALLFETQGELKKFMNKAKIDSIMCAQEFITVYERFLKWAGVKINE